MHEITSLSGIQVTTKTVKSFKNALLRSLPVENALRMTQVLQKVLTVGVRGCPGYTFRKKKTLENWGLGEGLAL